MQSINNKKKTLKRYQGVRQNKSNNISAFEGFSQVIFFQITFDLKCLLSAKEICRLNGKEKSKQVLSISRMARCRTSNMLRDLSAAHPETFSDTYISISKRFEICS